MQLFEKVGDYEAFERVLEETLQGVPMRICAFCAMPRRGRPALQRKSATNALCKSAGVESDGMHRRNAHEAQETDDDNPTNRRREALQYRLLVRPS
jgi:hypothetical protein